MKFVRIQSENNGPEYGILENETVRLIKGDLFNSGYTITDKVLSLNRVNLLAPCQPGKVVCVGLNYKDHADEVGFALPKQPLIFLKSPSSINHPNGEIIYPSVTRQLEYEGELAIVIKKEAKNVRAEEAYNYILGYTCANDVTARDIQRSESQWMRAKSFDTFLPLGPCIETEIDPNNVKIRSYLNGQLRQDSSTALFIYNVPEILEFASQAMTLYPGDVILTGSPKGTGAMKVGDLIEVELEGIGRLSNLVSERQTIAVSAK
jgi:2-keto-4-pentenoate hydratase/2-oxohepta-3-ene-1,7-dioic acid hydratase in catechol pathway